jgi:hypothetical protein
MSLRYGVDCASGLGHFIPLEYVTNDAGNAITFYAVPTEPILCPDCGFSALYGPKDGRQQDMADTIPNAPRP